MADHDDTPGSDDDVRDALTRWQPAGPATGFADRVALAHAAVPAPARTRSRPGWPMWTAVGVAAAMVGVVMVWPASAPPPVATAARTIAGRESIALGGRGVAVAEAGTVLAWRRAGAAAFVTQDAGDVFYRVDPGGPFTVTTPAGEVRVAGTCFRVEILPMKPTKQGLIGAGAGAVLATIAVVTVYEGKVLVASPAGTTEVAAGQRATLEPGVGPALTPDPAPSAVATTELPGEPSATITRDELLVRDKAQREQLALLSTKIRQLEAGGGAVPVGRHRKPGGPGGIENWLDPTKDELLAMAKECHLQIDLPPVMRGTPMQIAPDDGKAAGLTDAELVVANQVFTDLAGDWNRRVRGWYVDGTGDAQGADLLSSEAMGQELQDKAAAGEGDALQRRLSQERAGLVPAPGPGAKLSAYERYFRAYADLGNEAERLLATKLGPEKAHALRAHNGGWPMRMSIAGCPGEDGSGVDGPPRLP